MTASTAPVSQTEQQVPVPWWLVLIEGIALVILGVLFLTAPAATALIFIQVLGIYWLIRGVLYIVQIFLDRSMWFLKLVVGILGIVAGIVILNHPILSPLAVGSALVIILAVQAIIGGIAGLIQGFRGGGWGAAILGVVTAIIGIWLLLNIGAATLALPWTIGILAIVGGIFAIVMAFRLK